MLRAVEEAVLYGFVHGGAQVDGPDRLASECAPLAAERGRESTSCTVVVTSRGSSLPAYTVKAPSASADQRKRWSTGREQEGVV